MSQRRIVMILSILVLIGALAGIAVNLLAPVLKKDKKPQKYSQIMESETVIHNGQKYQYDTDQIHILFMGIDTSDAMEELLLPGYAGQADCLFIFSFDKSTKKTSLLQIPRDAVTEVDLYGVGGDCYSTIQAPIATQYAYSTGGKASCWATVKTVSEYLYGLPIDGYISLNLDGVRAIHEAIGGVTLEIPEDYTEINPSFQKGAVVTLDAEMAEQYIRYRDTTVTGSNMGRMRRQRQYIPALIEAVRSSTTDGQYYKRFASIAGDYMTTDLSGDRIDWFAGADFAEDDMYLVPGKVTPGEKYDEFYPDSEKFYDLIIKLFYKSM